MALVKSGSRSKEELEKFACDEAEAPAASPEVDGREAARQLGRTIMSCFGFGQEKPKVATETFHELTARMNSGEAVKFDMFKGKVLMVVNVATEWGLTKQNYAELADICSDLKDEPFEVLAFPCNQFGKQEKGNSEQIGDFITGKLTDSNFSIFEKCHVNGRHTHPVWHFCRYNADMTRNRRHMFVIPWNFAKFIIDKEGRVFKYYSPKVPPSQIKPDIQALLANTVKAAPSQPRTIKAEDAPPGFLSSSKAVERKISSTGTTLFL